MIGLWHSRFGVGAVDVREALPVGCEERLLLNSIAVRVRESNTGSQCSNRVPSGDMKPGV